MAEQDTALIFVSTLGQARNAKTLIEQCLRSTECLVVVLGTKANITVPEKITAILSESSIQVQVQMLPLSPGTITLPKVFKFQSIYGKLLREKNPDSIWIANANKHYAFLAAMAERKNIGVSYFEEGLGTYKRREYILQKNVDPSIKEKLYSLKDELRKYIRVSGVGAFIRFIFNEIRFIIRFFRRVFLVFGNIIASSSRVRSILKPFLPAETDHHFGIHSRYNQVRVAFPKSLDPQLYQSYDVDTLPVTVGEEDRLTALVALDAIGRSVPQTLYISQNYGGKNEKFYQCVAACLTNKNSLAVKFHPKESADHRSYLMNSLEEVGVIAVELDTFDTIPAEVAISTGHFKEIIGITSTTLFYSSLYKSIEIQTSIAPQLIEVLEQRRFNPKALDVLRLDYSLLGSLIEAPEDV